MELITKIIFFSLVIEIAELKIIKKDATYSILAPTTVRPGQNMRISATVFKLESDSFTVTSVVKRTNHAGTETREICSGKHTFLHVGSFDIVMKTPEEMSYGNYTLRVSGYSDPRLTGLIFSNETELFYDSKQISVFILTSKPFYRRGQTLSMKIIPVRRNLLPASTTMDVRIKDPLGRILREWFSQHTNAGGVVTLDYPINKLYPQWGDWLIEVDCMNHIYTKDIVVDEYYPPKGFVNVTMPTSMISNDISLAGTVESFYTSRMPASGNATIKLEFISPDSDGQLYPPIVRKLDNFNGRAEFLFTRQEMVSIVGENGLMGKELKVTGYVQDWWMNNTASSSQSAIVIDKTARIRFLEGGVITFKPGLPFQVHIAAEHADGSPLSPHNTNRTVYIDIRESYDESGDKSRSTQVKLSMETGVGEIQLNPGTKINRFFLTAKYENEPQTRRDLVASRYWSPSKSYIHVTTSTHHPSVDRFMIFDIVTNTFIETVYYVIVSGGNIISSNQIEMYTKSKQVSIALTQDMVPTAKMVAYFVTPDGQVVADGLNFHVALNSAHQVKARINRGKDLTYSSIELTVTGDPLAYVAFGAVEYNLYDYGTRNGLSQPEVISELYSYDKHGNTSVYHTWEKNGVVEDAYPINTRSYGHDANTTFFYSGLYIFTDANASAVYTACNRTEGDYPCMDGLSCYDYKDICTYKSECPGDRRDEMGCNNRSSSVILHGSKYWRSKKIRHRSHAASTGYMWSDLYLKPDGRNDVRFPISNYPSTWVITALAISREHGLTVLQKPIYFDGERPLFMRLEAAPIVHLHEHISISIVLFNNWDDEVDVLVRILKSPDYDPINWSRDSNQPLISEGEHQVLVPVMAGSRRQLRVPLVMRKVGKVAVKVEAVSLLGTVSQTQNIKVQYDGIKQTYITSYQVDLSRANSEVIPDFNIPVRERYVDQEQRLQNYVQRTPKSYMYIVGDIIGVGLAPEYNNYITGRNLLNSPDYCAMNALFSFVMNFYSLTTRRSLSTISRSQTSAIIKSLNLGLQEILHYINPDGSVNMFRWSQQPSTWITALVLDELSEIRARIGDLYDQIQIPPLDTTALWLSSQTAGVVSGAQAEAGNINNKFFESRHHIEVDGVMIPSNVSLTAACLLALHQAYPSDTTTQEKLLKAQSEARAYLFSHIADLDDPFEVAITTYALSVAKHSEGVFAMKRLKEIRRDGGNALYTYWSTMDIPPIKRSNGGLDSNQRQFSKDIYNMTAYTVSATSFGLMSYMSHNEPRKDINRIQAFLQTQRMNIGGWTSSYDTLLAVRALSALASQDQNRVSYEMDFMLRSDQDRDWRHTVHLNNDNWFIPQKVPLPSHWGSIQTTVKGHGIALLQMKTDVNYEHPHQLRPSSADYFDINHSITTSGFNHTFIHYKICPSWKGPGERSGLAVLEFDNPSGYYCTNGGTQKQIKANSKVQSIRQGACRNGAGQATIYFDYLDRTQNNCFSVKAERRRIVANITEHHLIRVFDFFEPGIYNQTIIDRVEFTKLTVCLACGSYQCPHCPYYAASARIIPSPHLIILTVIFAFVSVSWISKPAGFISFKR